MVDLRQCWRHHMPADCRMGRPEATNMMSLTTANMPRHQHNITSAAGGAGSASGTIGRSGENPVSIPRTTLECGGGESTPMRSGTLVTPTTVFGGTPVLISQMRLLRVVLGGLAAPLVPNGSGRAGLRVRLPMAVTPTRWVIGRTRGERRPASTLSPVTEHHVTGHLAAPLITAMICVSTSTASSTTTMSLSRT